jgi:hypothetical protein
MEYTKNLSLYIRENYTAGNETYHLRDIMFDFSYTDKYIKTNLTAKQVAELLMHEFSIGCKPKQIKKVKYTCYIKNLRRIESE